MLAKSKRWLVLIAVVVLAGCGDKTAVPWQDYAADLQPRLDSLAAAKNCAGLQREFDAADANNAATRTRTGHSNTDLMKYINDLIEACP